MNRCRALVLVDGSAIRKKIKKDYEKALRDLENSRRLLDQFQAQDLPQFTRWFNGRFGALLTELRELSQKIAADEALIFQVENELFFGARSPAHAYKRVKEFQENPPPPPPPSSDRNGDGDEESDPFGAPPEFGDEDGGPESFAEFLDEIFGDFGPHGARDGYFDPRHGPRPKPSSPAAVMARVKDLYRKLVRYLHPDAQEQMTAQKTEWWHQAQAAYTAGDAEQLEVILTLCEIGETGTTVNTTATLLHRITAQLKNSVREIKRQLAERRRDPAWNFSGRTDHEVMAIQMRNGMSRDLEEMRERWAETQAIIADWKAGAERLNQPRKRKRRPQNAEFPF